MPFEDAKKIIDEIASKESLRGPLQRIKTGEGGDALLNPEYLKIVRYIKQVMPEKEVVLHNNLQRLSKEITDALIDEKLIDVFICNVDGADKEHYEKMKNIPFENSINNLMYFFEKRKKANRRLPIEIYSLSFNMYIAQISSALGVLPLNATPEDIDKWDCDYHKVQAILDPYLDKSTDILLISRVFGWAEREQFANAKIDYRYHTCPCVQKNELETFAYIATDGAWYICCWDNKNETIFGNVLETSFEEVLHSERRKQLIQLVNDRKFGEVGGPCKTVNCCDMRMSPYVFEGSHGYMMPLWWDNKEAAAKFVLKNWYCDHSQ